jgi:hypothetical protein
LPQRAAKDNSFENGSEIFGAVFLGEKEKKRKSGKEKATIFPILTAR